MHPNKAPGKIMILLTGATGFVGGAILDRLKNVRCVVRSHINFEAPCELKVIKDFSDISSWQAALRGVEVVIHAAGKAHKRIRKNDEKNLFEVNTELTLRVAKCAAAAGVRRFIFISSIAVFDTEKLDFIDDSTMEAPSTAYGKSKRDAEVGLLDIASKTGLEVVLIRPPLIYGRNAPGNFRRIKNLALSSMPLPFSGLNQERSFIAVENLAEFVVRCINDPNAANEKFLVSDINISTCALIEKIRRSSNLPPRLFYVSPKIIIWISRFIGFESEIKKLTRPLILASEKPMNLLGWQPASKIDDFLNKK